MTASNGATLRSRRSRRAPTLAAVVLAGEDGERSEPPAAGAAEGRLEYVRKVASDFVSGCGQGVESVGRRSLSFLP
jgi:hypothetical protein